MHIAGTHRIQKVLSDPVDLELQVVNHYVSAGNQTRASALSGPRQMFAFTNSISSFVLGCWFPRAALIYHRKAQAEEVYSHRPGVYLSKMMMSTELFSFWRLYKSFHSCFHLVVTADIPWHSQFYDDVIKPLLLSLCVPFPLYVCLSLQVSNLIKTPSHWIQGLHWSSITLTWLH